MLPSLKNRLVSEDLKLSLLASLAVLRVFAIMSEKARHSNITPSIQLSKSTWPELLPYAELVRPEIQSVQPTYTQPLVTYQ